MVPSGGVTVGVKQYLGLLMMATGAIVTVIVAIMFVRNSYKEREEKKGHKKAGLLWQVIGFIQTVLSALLEVFSGKRGVVLLQDFFCL